MSKSLSPFWSEACGPFSQHLLVEFADAGLAQNLHEGDWSAESGFAAAVNLLEREPRGFTAIVAANDHMASGERRHCGGKRLGKHAQLRTDLTRLSGRIRGPHAP
jgi:hypothetical protein